LLSASFLALHHERTNTLKARTAHSELVFRLHPNNNIGESYRKFGISDDTTTLIAVKLSLSPATTAESVAKHLGETVQGQSVDIGEKGQMLGRWADLERVRKVYKLDGRGKKRDVNGAASQDDERKELEGVILGIMTVKGS
jgi:EKC/KEOPS complex subunit CGI121/TPRKB